ncbi:atherin-like isoform X2 [Manacus candei]|uniref:atherin-like isoform X1 n=1 Tax=Manacus candei TaxID=415023 RepID=UPI0022276EE4|nr:atherin-like isoform X1 [Manacus candei]XP_051649406.1 atherin-like isoform X2 [Manacus candei]
MAARGPLASERLPDLRRDPDPRPAPAAPSRRAASRCGDRAGRSAAPGAGGRFVGGGRHWRGQPPSQDPTRPRRAAPRRAARSSRSAPLPLPLPLPLPPPLPPCPGDAIGAAPPPSPPRKRPTPADPTEIGPGVSWARRRGGRGRSSASPAAIGDCRPGKRQVTKLMEEKTKGLEAPSFPSVTVGVPDASGRTNPVAFMSNVLCCVCLQNCHERKYFRGASLQISPEYARRFQPGGKELWKKSSLKIASGDHQVFQPRRTRREMRESGSNS